MFVRCVYDFTINTTNVHVPKCMFKCLNVIPIRSLSSKERHAQYK